LSSLPKSILITLGGNAILPARGTGTFDEQSAITRLTMQPIAQLIRRALRDVEPHARELGSDRELEGIRDILARGNGSDRQLRIFNANRDIVEVTREISDATEAGAAVKA